MNRAQRRATMKTSPDLFRAAILSHRWCRPMSGACLCSAALLLVLLSCPAFASAAEGVAREGEGEAAHAPHQLGPKENAVAAQPASAQRKAVADPVRAYGMIAAQLIKVHWRYIPQRNETDWVTGVALWVNPQGKVTDARIVSSSGSAKADASVLHAVQEVGTLPPPPAGFKGKMRINFCFDDPHFQPPSKVENAGNAVGSHSGE